MALRFAHQRIEKDHLTCPVLDLRDRSESPLGDPGAADCSRKGVDERVDWRIVYRVDSDAIVIFEVFEKKTRKTPQSVIDVCKRRLADYDA